MVIAVRSGLSGSPSGISGAFLLSIWNHLKVVLSEAVFPIDKWAAKMPTVQSPGNIMGFPTDPTRFNLLSVHVITQHSGKFCISV